MHYQIEKMEPSDWKQVCDIYAQGIKTGRATFQAEVPSWEEWNRGHIRLCRLVARSGDDVLGWAALSPTSSRSVYAGVAELSLYIDEKHQGQGVGAALLTHLITVSEDNGFWTLQSVIIRENAASIRLHTKCGFREVGIREKIAKMSNGAWHDTVLMERRSKRIGMDSALI